MKYNSIYVHQDKYTDRSRDTVYIKEKQIEYRFWLQRDTIRIAKIDSIPYEVKIIETKEVRKPPNGIGYHYVIRRDGSIELGRPESMIGAHVKDHNRHSIGICYEGGLNAEGKPEDTRTPQQKATMRALLEDLNRSYPRAVIVGHNTFANKACPCFRPETEYADLQPK